MDDLFHFFRLFHFLKDDGSEFNVQGFLNSCHFQLLITRCQQTKRSNLINHRNQTFEP
jgi:hypothetical protein